MYLVHWFFVSLYIHYVFGVSLFDLCKFEYKYIRDAVKLDQLVRVWICQSLGRWFVSGKTPNTRELKSTRIWAT